MRRDPGTPTDSFYEVLADCTDVPKTRFRIKDTLSARKWQAAFFPEGDLDIGRTLSRIQHGGVHPSIRREVWEFLLGCYDPKSTFDERDELQQRRRLQYAWWKEECKQMFPLIGSGRFVTAPIISEDGRPVQDPLVLLQTNPMAGAVMPINNGENPSRSISASSAGATQVITDKKEIEWKLTLHQIDRTLVFYETQENLSKLWDVLTVYAWIDKDVGYCQEPDLGGGKAYGPKGKPKSIRQCGKFEWENIKNGGMNAHGPLPISIFLVESVLKDKSSKLLQEAHGLDDVVDILNDLTGNLDAK